ncbi:hypothetical protein HC928_10980 [bacterium]|nr:hypothetical protein [bacterium]
MAYALLAGLPPSMGLYASILPVLIYGLLGTSPVLTMGPTAITSVLILATLQPIAHPSDPRFAALAITLALYLGVVLVLLGLFRLGWIVNFLSQPVLVGYINAAAIIIGVSQVQHLTGIDIPNTRAPFCCCCTRSSASRKLTWSRLPLACWHWGCCCTSATG